MLNYWWNTLATRRVGLPCLTKTGQAAAACEAGSSREGSREEHWPAVDPQADYTLEANQRLTALAHFC
jgi:hypothetical protein